MPFSCPAPRSSVAAAKKLKYVKGNWTWNVFARRCKNGFGMPSVKISAVRCSAHSKEPLTQVLCWTDCVDNSNQEGASATYQQLYKDLIGVMAALSLPQAGDYRLSVHRSRALL